MSSDREMRWENILVLQERGMESQGKIETLEKGMATHSSSCLGNPMDRGAWWATYSPWGCKELDMTEHIHIGILLEEKIVFINTIGT